MFKTDLFERSLCPAVCEKFIKVDLEEASFESSLKGISYKPLIKRVFVQITFFSFHFLISLNA